MQTFSLTLSNYMLVTIAIERHRAVSNPLHHSGASYRYSLLKVSHCSLSLKELLTYQGYLIGIKYLYTGIPWHKG